MNEVERITGEINALKSLLSDTDYKALKYAEGVLSEAEYAAVRAQRQSWRDEINRLEYQINLERKCEV